MSRTSTPEETASVESRDSQVHIEINPWPVLWRWLARGCGLAFYTLPA